MILVMTATPNEMKAAFPDAPKVAQGEVAEYNFKGRSLLLSVTGVGLVNTALATGALLERSDVKGVVNLGIAGAYDVEEFPLLSTCYCWQETWPEYGLLDDEGGVDPKGIGFPQGEVNGQTVWNRVKLNPVNDAEAMGLTLGDKWLRASSVTISGVTGTPERAGWLKLSCNANMENMEGFGLAYGVLQKRLPFLEVRTISNLVASREAEDWELKGAFKRLGEAADTLFTA
ncbi:futalosine hydrolase [uncultured Pseudodesulfovibrio sp.]|uniref:futalosine hydrolase n=1 Tax=uncultured Pseudodesulfovibrio sp. TaxID=2035858 RepID=UPI0029C98186|nr:futalosine hydrolase [uncultured Pseudodesulfovibrio sp.]